MPIPVIDLFAGPGGLGEGFSALPGGPFKIKLSIEKEQDAHQTLELRAFYRQFIPGPVPPEYYKHLKGTLSKDDLFKKFPSQAAAAQREAWHSELGSPDCTKHLDARISEALAGAKDWVLIGGPPCQAYSMAGRSRNGGIDPGDDKVTLYQEYLAILATHRPPIFVMENVKGLLSAKNRRSKIFDQILRDLENPAAALNGETTAHTNPAEVEYQIFSLARSPRGLELFGRPIFKDADFVLKCENYGIPQARHRVILLGLRRRRFQAAPTVLVKQRKIPVARVISGLPRLRSGLSKEADDKEKWLAALKAMPGLGWFERLAPELQREIRKTLKALRPPRSDRGGEFVRCSVSIRAHHQWFLDGSLAAC
jgi:DNA (cytosine-5)-methyltransferase 1